jgi:cytochrome c peroxidase
MTVSSVTNIRRFIAGAVASMLVGAAQGAPPPSGLTLALDPSGVLGIYNVAGATDPANPFFQSLGSNGRSCATCHIATQAMSFTPAEARRRFLLTLGADPLFAAVDGANCDTVRRGSVNGHSLILRNGLIRIALPVPTDAEYSIAVVSDPYGCALRVDPKTHVLTASVYRRPLPAANLGFLSAVMFDARETPNPLTSTVTFDANLRADLASQAIDATTGHAEAAAPPSDAAVQAIVEFELGLFTAQLADSEAGALTARGAGGGPVALAAQAYYPGINDSLGADPLGNPFTPLSMTLYSSWETLSSQSGGDQAQARADIAAGEKLFNTADLTISNVRGLNDNAAIGRPTSFTGHCSTCHDAPNVGDHSLPLALDIGTSHIADMNFESDPQITAGSAQLSMPDLPIFLISGCPNPFNPGQPESFYTSDPGRALITGKCADFNRIKGPILRGLAARAPYFHNGSAATLTEVVNFYNQRFQMNLTDQQVQQLVAFLKSL